MKQQCISNYASQKHFINGFVTCIPLKTKLTDSFRIEHMYPYFVASKKDRLQNDIPSS